MDAARPRPGLLPRQWSARARRSSGPTSPGCPDDIVFAGRLEKIPLSVSVGYRTVYSPEVRAITLVHGGVSGVESPEDADALLAALRGVPLERRRGRPLAAGASRRLAAPHGGDRGPRRRCAAASAHRSTHWALRLPDSYDEFIKSRSKKTRENVRVYGNRLQRDHGDGLSLRVYRDPAEMDELLAEIETVAALTYQRGLGVAAADTDEDRMLTELALEQAAGTGPGSCRSTAARSPSGPAPATTAPSTSARPATTPPSPTTRSARTSSCA